MKIRSSINFKFLCGLLSISLIPLFMIVAVTVYSDSRFYSEMFSQASYQELKQLVDEVDRNLGHVDDISMALIMSQMNNESIVLSICEQEGVDEIRCLMAGSHWYVIRSAKTGEREHHWSY